MEIPEQLTLLAELSHVEKKMRERNYKLESIPAKARDAEAAAEKCKQAHAVIDQQRINTEKERRTLEMSLQEAKDHLKKWNLRLDKIRDDREHAALQSEIGGQKRAISRLENDIIELMEQLEEQDEGLKKAQSAWDEAAAFAKEEFDKVSDEVKVLESELAELDTARQALAVKLPDALVKRYSAIAARRQGQGVAIIKGEVCSACRTSLPPQLCVQVYKGALIETCQVCQRILVHEAMTRADVEDKEAASA